MAWNVDEMVVGVFNAALHLQQNPNVYRYSFEEVPSSGTVLQLCDKAAHACELPYLLGGVILFEPWLGMNAATRSAMMGSWLGFASDGDPGWSAGEIGVFRKGRKTQASAPLHGRAASEAELNGSIGEGPNQTNCSDRSSVRILAKFRNFR